MRAYDHVIHKAVDLAAAHVHEAICELRSTRGRMLAIPQRALINGAIRGLEAVHDLLRRFQEEPCPEQQPPKRHRQMNLL